MKPRVFKNDEPSGIDLPFPVVAFLEKDLFLAPPAPFGFLPLVNVDGVIQPVMKMHNKVPSISRPAFLSIPMETTQQLLL